jgi:hypothetical protein
MSEYTFRGELESVINRHSQENGCNTPDFILANYLINCLLAFDTAVNARERWYGRNPGWRPEMQPASTEWPIPPAAPETASAFVPE